jgi:hypothetical protein
LFDNPVGCPASLAIFRLTVAKLHFLVEAGAETEVSKQRYLTRRRTQSRYAMERRKKMCQFQNFMQNKSRKPPVPATPKQSFFHRLLLNFD